MGSRMATHSTWCVIRLLSTVYSERHGGSIHLRAATPAADGFPRNHFDAPYHPEIHHTCPPNR